MSKPQESYPCPGPQVEGAGLCILQALVRWRGTGKKPQRCKRCAEERRLHLARVRYPIPPGQKRQVRDTDFQRNRKHWIVHLRDADHLTFSEIGRRMQVSRQRAAQLYTEGLCLPATS